MNRIIDIHAHTSESVLWDLHTKSASLDTLRSLSKQYGISKIYLLATYFPLKKSTGLTNEILLERVVNDPLFGCFGSLNLETDFGTGLSQLTGLAQSGALSGIKIYSGYQNIVLSDPKFTPLFQLAEKHGLPVACHMGELHHCCPKNERETLNEFRCGKTYCAIDQQGDLAHPKQIGAVAKLFPKVNFIACHLGNPFFDDMRQAMSECPNLYTDISGQFVSGTDEDSPKYRIFIKNEIEKFLKLEGGVERVLFGTDFPIQSYKDSLELVSSLKLSKGSREKILWENSQKFLNPNK